MMIMIVGLQ